MEKLVNRGCLFGDKPRPISFCRLIDKSSIPRPVIVLVVMDGDCEVTKIGSLRDDPVFLLKTAELDDH